jgi:hypothetical protein
MSWNCHVIKRVIGGEDSYGIHEVYYAADGTIRAWSENPIIPTGKTPEELKKDFSVATSCFRWPNLRL